MDLVITAALAAVLGVIVGVLPGVGMLNAMLLTWPWLITLETTELLVFYAVLASLTQFTGSVMATLTGIPGELSSVPAAREGPRLVARGQGDRALAQASLASAMATILIGLVVMALAPMIMHLVLPYYSTHAQTFLLCLVVLIMIAVSGRSWWCTLIMTALGMTMALIGNPIDGAGLPRFNWGHPDLYSGVPVEVMAVCLVAIPQVLTLINDHPFRAVPVAGTWASALRESRQYLPSTLRGAGLGAMAGMVPGMAFTLSSLVAYQLERWLRGRDLRTDGDLHTLVSAESANNSGVLTSMIPVLFLGLPIVASEALLLNLVANTGTQVLPGTLAQHHYFWPVVLCFMVSAAMGAVVAWRGSNLAMCIFRVPGPILRWGLVSVLISSIVIAGTVNQQLTYYIIVMLVLLPLGWLLRRWDTSAVVLGFLIYPALEQGLVRSVVLYF